MGALFRSLSWFLLSKPRNLSLLPKEGIINNTEGYPGMVYQTVSFKPLCGNIGTDDRYHVPFDLSNRCTSTIEAFEYNTNDLVAIYETTGERLEPPVIGNGREICLCFALRQLNDLSSGICIWVDGAGQSENWPSLDFGHGIAGSHRPNITKALPYCDGERSDETSTLPEGSDAQLRLFTKAQTTSSIINFSNQADRPAASTLVTRSNSANGGNDGLMDRDWENIACGCGTPITPTNQPPIETNLAEPSVQADIFATGRLAASESQTKTVVYYVPEATNDGTWYANPGNDGNTYGGAGQTTSTRSMTTSTYTTTMLSTDTNGLVATWIGTVTTEVPVRPSDEPEKKEGWSREAKIGLGVGIPPIFLTIIGLIWCKNH